MIGLKGSLKYWKDAGLKTRLINLKWELVYAFQRAWRGYDDVDVFSLYDRFNERMIAVLKDFKDSNIGLWNDNGRELSEEETDKAIEKMIRHFEKADANGWIDLDYNPLTDEGMKAIERFETEAQANQMAALRDFQKWFYQLWI